MRFLIIGDIYGKEGKKIIKEKLSSIKEELKPDFIIANGENVSFGGKSLIRSDYNKLKSYGIDYFTMGNHTFKNKDINLYIDEVNDIVRPANLVGNFSGKGFQIFEFNKKKILLINLLGIVFINMNLKNPFHVAEDILKNNEYDLAIIDFHAEATSEKIVLANYLSKKYEKLAIFFGTHTHIQTSDERIFNNNTAYITDVGMTGVFNSAIGADFEAVTNKMLNGTLSKFVEAKGNDWIFNSIIVDVDPINLKPISIKRYSKRY